MSKNEFTISRDGCVWPEVIVVSWRGRAYGVEISDGPDDDELKRRLSKMMNGDYITEVCTRCGTVYFSGGVPTQPMKIEFCEMCVTMEDRRGRYFDVPAVENK